MKTICYLRLSTTFVKGLIEAFNQKYHTRFIFEHIDEGYTKVTPFNLQGKTSEELIKNIRTLNNYCNKIIPAFRCYVQGIVVFEEERKVIICNNKKINCYDFDDVRMPLLDFVTSFGYFDRQIAETNDMLNMFNVIVMLRKGKSLDILYCYCKQRAEENDPKGFYKKLLKLFAS